MEKLVVLGKKLKDTEKIILDFAAIAAVIQKLREDLLRILTAAPI